MTLAFRILALTIALAILAACTSSPASPPASRATPTPTLETDCAQSILAGLSPTQKAGQLIFVGLAGNQLGPAERAAITTYGAGSVWFSELTAEPSSAVAAVSAEVQALAAPATHGVGFFVGANQEGGQIDQFHGPGFSPIPSALEQGTQPPPTLEAEAALWASQLKAAGVNLNLAPVMDTVPAGTDSSNAPIGALQREFGHDPATVSSHGLAFLAGMHESKVLVTIKHFPGLGRVVGNTDFTATVVDRATTSTDPYLGPFQDAVDAGADMVMVSTAIYTNIDADHLAVFSPAVIGLLRHQLKFSGVIVSDDLGAAVAVASIPAGDRAVEFIAAGGDLITVKNTNLVGPMVTALLNRSETDPAFSAELDAAALHVLELKVSSDLVSCAG